MGQEGLRNVWVDDLGVENSIQINARMFALFLSLGIVEIGGIIQY